MLSFVEIIFLCTTVYSTWYIIWEIYADIAIETCRVGIAVLPWQLCMMERGVVFVPSGRQL